MDPTKNDNHVKWYLATQVILSAAHIGMGSVKSEHSRTMYDLCRFGVSLVSDAMGETTAPRC